MSGKRRSKSQIARDRRRISDLYLQGWLQADIAAEVGVSEATISRDLKVLHQEWLDSALVDINDVKSKELVKIDQLEREYWDAWQRSKLEALTSLNEEGVNEKGSYEKHRETIRYQVGDSRYLAGVQWCIEQRCKIIGIEAPKRHELTGADGSPIIVQVGGVSLDEV